MKFYKKSNGTWILGERKIPAGTCVLKINSVDGKISIEQPFGGFIHNADDYSYFEKENGDAYASLTEFEEATDSFFLKAAGGISSGQEVIGALGFTPADEANTLTLQVETVEYYNNLIASGGDIDAISLSAIDKFIVKGKASGWWNAQKDMCIFLKTKGGINSALIKLKNTLNKAIINHGYVDADVKSYGLFAGTVNNSKYLDCNISIAELGVSLQNFSVATFEPILGTPDYRFSGQSGAGCSYGPILSVYKDDATTNNFTVGFNGANVFGTRSDTHMPCGVDMHVGRSLGYTSYINGVNYADNVSIGNASIEGNIHLQRRAAGGTLFYGNIPLSFYSVGTTLTDDQALSFSRDILVLMIDLNRIPISPFGIGFGDSITKGETLQDVKSTWMHLAMSKLGMANINIGCPGRSIYKSTLTAGLLDGFSVYPQVNKLNLGRTTVFFALGTNDMRGQDNNANDFGNTAVLNNVYNISISIISSFILNGYNVIIVSPAINTENPISFSVNKQLDYVKKVASIAKLFYNNTSSGVGKICFINTYHLLLDNPTGVLADGVHFSAIGHRLVGNEINRVYLGGGQKRSITLSFPTINALSKADLNVMVLNAEVGMSVNLGLPIDIDGGLVATAFVSANDTVTVRLTNMTGNAITPTSGKYTIVVNTGY